MKKILCTVLAALVLILCACDTVVPDDTAAVTHTKGPSVTAPPPETFETIGQITNPPETDPVSDTAAATDTSDVTDAETEPAAQTTAPIVEVLFKTDLSEYEIYMMPDNSDEYLILVNADNSLSENYIPEDLTDLADTRDDGRAMQQMRLYAAKSLEAFLIEARANGCKDVSVTSAYRSYARQEYLFNIYVENEMSKNSSLSREEAVAIVMLDTALPGKSEHQSGLACDMHNLGSASQAFAEKPEAKWLAENAWKFGFILRYPSDKEDVTEIIYEPWHFRFVGRYHAKAMYDMGMCLEEYVDYLSKRN